MAAVVINLSLGNNGILNKAIVGKNNYMSSANQEKDELDNIDIDNLTGDDMKKEPITTENSYIGYYADIDNDGIVDGVIYADLAFDLSGYFGGNYSYSKVENLKNYNMSVKKYNGSFGQNNIITTNGTGNDRFYVLALSDIDSSKQYTWYLNGDISDYNSVTKKEFGEGRTNTSNMIGKWNNSIYGKQSSQDMWNVVQSYYEQGWFVPSWAEWSAIR